MKLTLTSALTAQRAREKISRCWVVILRISHLLCLQTALISNRWTMQSLEQDEGALLAHANPWRDVERFVEEWSRFDPEIIGDAVTQWEAHWRPRVTVDRGHFKHFLW